GKKKKSPAHIELPPELSGQNAGTLMSIQKGFEPVKLKQKPELTRILFIFDDSQSMLGQWQSGSKIEVAKKLMGELLDSLKKAENLEVALRVYGHQKHYPPQDCDDSKLEVP